MKNLRLDMQRVGGSWTGQGLTCIKIVLFFALFPLQFIGVQCNAKDYSIQNSKSLMVFEKFLYHAFSPSSWWSCCISLGGPLLVLGWSGRWSWHSKQRNYTEPCNSSCCYWSLWLLLFRTCCFPKHLHFNGKTRPISCSPLNMVNSRCSIILSLRLVF